jgi:hypothetical protein
MRSIMSLARSSSACRPTASWVIPIGQVKFVIATGLDWLTFGDVFVWGFGGARAHAVYH